SRKAISKGKIAGTLGGTFLAANLENEQRTNQGRSGYVRSPLGPLSLDEDVDRRAEFAALRQDRMDSESEGPFHRVGDVGCGAVEQWIGMLRKSPAERVQALQAPRLDRHT